MAEEMKGRESGPARGRDGASGGREDPARGEQAMASVEARREAQGAEAGREEDAEGEREEGAGVEREDGAEAMQAHATKLTDRDRDILGLLAITRYLTVQQIHRLAFAGGHISAAYRRLLKLSRGDGQAPFVRQRFFRTYDGNRVAVWAPTPRGVMAASARAGGLPELPRHDVGAQFLEHAIQLNELFVALWQTETGRCARVAHPSFRWIPSDCVRLTWGEYEMMNGRRQLRIIQPDAVLELPVQRRRYFLECEMGGHTISPGPSKPPGATLSKAERYQTYLCGYADLASGRAHYDARYPDRFQPEVLFLVRSTGRAESINAALAAWKKRTPERRYAVMRAITFEVAAGELRGLVGLPLRPNMLPGPAVPATLTITREEALLLRRYVHESWAALKRARATFRQLQRSDLPEYPGSLESMAELAERLIPSARR